MKDSPTRGRLLGPVLQRYFCEHMINQRRLSPRTVSSYRDTFRLFLGFVEERRGIRPDDVRVADLDAKCVLEFLDALERSRQNSARTRNARLAAIRSFFRFAARADPLTLAIAQPVLAIPSKRFDRGVVRHLAPAQMQALLDVPDGSSWSGMRDRVLVTLLYNTGARVSEVAALKVADVRLERAGSVLLHGKGRKERAVPLWNATARLLRAWLRQTNATPDAPLIPNGRGAHMTRSGVEQRLRVLVRRATTNRPDLAHVRISPHVIRHTTAMHLLQSGVDLSVIAMWLGHESLETTHQYLDADLESKKRALDHLPVPRVRRSAAGVPNR